MDELPNRLSDVELEQEVASYRLYLELLQWVQDHENDRCPGLSTRSFYHHGKLDIHSCSPDEPHFIGSLEYDRKSIIFSNFQANSAADAGLMEPNWSSMISTAANQDVTQQFEDLLYVLPAQIREAYDIAVALRDATSAIDHAVEKNNRNSRDNPHA
jgi:hypothetical protein